MMPYPSHGDLWRNSASVSKTFPRPQSSHRSKRLFPQADFTGVDRRPVHWPLRLGPTGLRAGFRGVGAGVRDSRGPGIRVLWTTWVSLIPLVASFLRLLSGGFPSLTAAMAENTADAIRHGIDAEKRMVVASSCSVAKRVTIPAHTMAVPNAAVAIARITGLISYFILSLVSQNFMGSIHSFFSLL